MSLFADAIHTLLPNPAVRDQAWSAGASDGKVSAHAYDDGAGHMTGYSLGGSWIENKYLSLLNAGLDVGNFRDASGKATYGLNAHAESNSLNVPLVDRPGKGSVNLEAVGGNANATATLNDSTLTLGAGAGCGGGGISAKTSDPHSKIDSYGRLALMHGVGAAGRLHYGDEDHDGHREYGFGADLGPLSFDVKSEDPVGVLANHLLLGPLGDVCPILPSHTEGADGTIRERNYTEELFGGLF